MWIHTSGGLQLSGRLTDIHVAVSTSRRGAGTKVQALCNGRTAEEVHSNVCREVTAEVVGPSRELMTGLAVGGLDEQKKGLRSHRGRRSALKLLSCARSPATSNAAKR